MKYINGTGAIWKRVEKRVWNIILEDDVFELSLNFFAPSPPRCKQIYAGKASTCHPGRRNTKESEVANRAVIADWEVVGKSTI